MKVKLDEGAKAPTRAHLTDAGLDIYSREAKKIMPHSSEIFQTGVHVEIPHGCAGLLVSKSGLSMAKDLTSTGLIDETYSGEIVVKLYNHGSTVQSIGKGQKITQLVVIPVRYEPVWLVDELEVTGRGDAGFGSTDNL